MNLLVKIFTVFLLIFSLFSCSKDKRTEKKLEGAWRVKSAVDGSGSLSTTDFIGMELEFEKCKGNDKCTGEFKNYPTSQNSCASCTYNSGGYTYDTGEFCGSYSEIVDAIEYLESYGYDCEYSSGFGSGNDVYAYFEYEAENKGRELELSLYTSDGLVIWFGEIEELTKKELKVNFYTSYGEYYKFEFQKK